MSNSSTVVETGVGEAPESSGVLAEHWGGAETKGGPGAVEVGGGDVQGCTAARDSAVPGKGGPSGLVPKPIRFGPNNAVSMFFGCDDGDKAGRGDVGGAEKRSTPPVSSLTIGRGSTEDDPNANPKT